MTDVTNGAYNWLTLMIEDQYGFTTDLYKMMVDDASMDLTSLNMNNETFHSAILDSTFSEICGVEASVFTLDNSELITTRTTFQGCYAEYDAVQGTTVLL